MISLRSSVYQFISVAAQALGVFMGWHFYIEFIRCAISKQRNLGMQRVHVLLILRMLCALGSQTVQIDSLGFGIV